MTNLNTFDRVVRECMADTGLSRAEAVKAVRRRYPALAPAPAQTGVANVGGNAEAQLSARAKEIMAARRCTFAQAYVEALRESPNLYVQYCQEHEAALGARRG